MSIPARLSIVTIGIADIARFVAFYEALGWQRCSSAMDEIAWLRTADNPGFPIGPDGRIRID